MLSPKPQESWGSAAALIHEHYLKGGCLQKFIVDSIL